MKGIPNQVNNGLYSSQITSGSTSKEQHFLTSNLDVRITKGQSSLGKQGWLESNQA